MYQESHGACELVRRVHKEGPQHVTIHGRDEVVVVSAAEYERLQGSTSGAAISSQLAPPQMSCLTAIDLAEIIYFYNACGFA